MIFMLAHSRPSAGKPKTPGRMAVNGSVKDMMTLVTDKGLPTIKMARIRITELTRRTNTNKITGLLGAITKQELAEI